MLPSGKLIHVLKFYSVFFQMLMMQLSDRCHDNNHGKVVIQTRTYIGIHIYLSGKTKFEGRAVSHGQRFFPNSRAINCLFPEIAEIFITSFRNQIEPTGSQVPNNVIKPALLKSRAP